MGYTIYVMIGTMCWSYEGLNRTAAMVLCVGVTVMLFFYSTKQLNYAIKSQIHNLLLAYQIARDSLLHNIIALLINSLLSYCLSIVVSALI